MKFAIRCSKNPVIMRFDGRVVPREIGDPVSSRIHLVSVCGIDFASRVHDHVDLTHYIKNWKEVYCFDDPRMHCKWTLAGYVPLCARSVQDDLARMKAFLMSGTGATSSSPGPSRS